MESPFFVEHTLPLLRYNEGKRFPNYISLFTSIYAKKN
jgi:hypothetical protein